jgi:hypothetical protein
LPFNVHLLDVVFAAITVVHAQQYVRTRRQNWTFSYKSNMAPEGAANVNIYAAFLRLAIPIKPTKLEPKRHTAGHTSF